MIQKMLIKKVFELVVKQIVKKHKLDKIQEYVEKPNATDKKVAKLVKEVNALKKLAHAPAKFVCTECGTKAKRVN